MRMLIVVSAAAGCLLIATGAFGQQRLNPIGQPHLNPIGQQQQRLNPVGQGNILHPGIPASGPPRVHRPGGGFGQGRTVFIPYGVPIDPFDGGYTGGGYGYSGGGYGYSGVFNPAPGTYDPIFGGYNPGVYAQAPQQQQQTPTVIINQNFQPDTVRPVLYDYANSQPPNVVQLDRPQPRNGTQQPALPDDQPTIFLIAMKDHTIYPVIAYWVDKETLNYVTVESGVKRVPLDQVDRDLSRQLNEERNVEFRLPAR
jgi:hypothetical protein